MKEFIITSNEANQKMHKYLGKVLKEAPSSFIYKMLRKKNITLNGKKGTGNEILQVGDTVCLYLSDDTFSKFQGELVKQENEFSNIKLPKEFPIIYEDEHILLLNKPTDMLSQKAELKDVSANEYFIKYMLDSNQIDYAQLKTFKPSICNRLDRNTTGILVCGKTLLALQEMQKALKERTVDKYYTCLVIGKVTTEIMLDGFLQKDESNNKVIISKNLHGSKSFDIEKSSNKEETKNKEQKIQTKIIPLETKYIEELGTYISKLKIHLITGKTHQIRAHLSSIGHPIIGDYKYGFKKENDYFKKKYGVASQLLHAFQLIFHEMTESLSTLSGKTFEAKEPNVFQIIMKE